MNLLTLLVNELDKWPKGVDALTQSALDTELYEYRVTTDRSFPLAGRVFTKKRHTEEVLYPVVTKGQWMAARKPTDAFTVRDTVIELEAYEEHFRRERESLISYLASEGFNMISITPFQTITSEDPSTWEAGDFVECTTSGSYLYTKGNIYEVKRVLDGVVSILDNDGKGSCGSCCAFDVDTVCLGEEGHSSFKLHTRGR